VSNNSKETARVEMFSDGVFAIAITLLSFGLVVPSHDHEPLLARLIHGWPRYIAFVTSFVTIGIVWINHHRLFTHIHRVSHGLLLWNGLLLMSVTLIPFTSGLVAEYVGHDDARTASAVYSASFVFTTLSFNLVWRHATHQHRLLDRHVTPAMIHRINLQYGFGPVLYLMSFAVAFVSGLASVIIDCAVAVFFALPAFTFADAASRASPIRDDPELVSG
jgi:uncharacterized membrane protein